MDAPKPESADPYREPLIKLDPPFRDPFRRAMCTVACGAAERLLAIDKVNDIYAQIGQLKDARSFMEKCLDVMDVEFDVPEEDLARIPKTGKVVVVANHPFGGIEGVVMACLLHGVRDDFKLMANFLLGRLEEFRKWLILVDPFDRADSAKINMRPIKECLRWLKDEHLLAVFPSGEVSHINLRRGGVTDPAWSPMIARLVRMTEATVVPIYFCGLNGPVFQLAGLVHPRLRTALLAKEFANKRNKTISIRVGNPIPFSKLREFEDDRAMIDYLRLRTYHLKNRKKISGQEEGPSSSTQTSHAEKEPVASGRSAQAIASDVKGLPAEQKLLESGNLEVWYARAGQIPNLLHEIGRLRELTFREAGEGTGREIDLDRFDDYYLHLFVWNSDKQEFVGAYRLGQTDEILPRFGKRGLYTSTLFRYRGKLLDRMNPALEMGRSFIRKEYQKNFTSLLLLWKGIGHFVWKFPRYKILFGPVSVNADYTRKSQELMVEFLRDNNALPRLAKMVRPRRPMLLNPLKKLNKHRLSHVVKDLDEVESLIADIESQMQGVPVLLRQYLKLGGKLLGFNIDPDFSNVLDGLILVDLTKTDPVILSRYFTKQGVTDLHAYHGLPPPEFKRAEKGEAKAD